MLRTLYTYPERLPASSTRLLSWALDTAGQPSICESMRKLALPIVPPSTPPHFAINSWWFTIDWGFYSESPIMEAKIPLETWVQPLLATSNGACFETVSQAWRIWRGAGGVLPPTIEQRRRVRGGNRRCVWPSLTVSGGFKKTNIYLHSNWVVYSGNTSPDSWGIMLIERSCASPVKFILLTIAHCHRLFALLRSSSRNMNLNATYFWCFIAFSYIGCHANANTSCLLVGLEVWAALSHRCCGRYHCGMLQPFSCWLFLHLNNSTSFTVGMRTSQPISK